MDFLASSAARQTRNSLSFAHSNIHTGPNLLGKGFSHRFRDKIWQKWSHIGEDWSESMVHKNYMTYQLLHYGFLKDSGLGDISNMDHG